MKPVLVPLACTLGAVSDQRRESAVDIDQVAVIVQRQLYAELVQVASQQVDPLVTEVFPDVPQDDSYKTACQPRGGFLGRLLVWCCGLSCCCPGF